MLDLLAAPSLHLAATDAILLLAVLQANVARVSDSPDLQVRYARLDTPPPADLYRPVSILAIADSLGLPFETTRRRIGRLAGAGLCEVSRAGCRVPPALIAGPGYEALADRSWSLLDGFCAHLAASGVAPRFHPVERRGDERLAQARLASRVLGDYVLRAVASAIPAHSDVVDRLMVMAVHAASARAAGIPPTISNGRIARETRTDTETTRRRLEALRTSGVLVRHDATGWRLGEAAQPALDVAARAHVASAHRCLAALERHGVLRPVSTRSRPGSAT